MRYSLTAFRAFEAAGRNLSLTKAAAELMVTRPAISKQIRLLETELGSRLFLRSPGRLQLTLAGESLLPTLSRSLSQMTEAADRIRAENEGSRKLRVLVEHDFGAAWLANNIGHFLIEQSGQPIDLITERQGSLRLDEDFDIRIFYFDPDLPIPEAERFDIVELCSWANLPLCAPDYMDKIDSGDNDPLKNASLLHDRDRRFWTEWLCEAGMDTSSADAGGTVFDSTSLCLSAAVSSAGIAIGDTLTAFDLLRSGRLVVPFQYAIRSQEKYLLMVDKVRTGRSGNRAFQEWIGQRMEQHLVAQVNLLSELSITTTAA